MPVSKKRKKKNGKIAKFNHDKNAARRAQILLDIEQGDRTDTGITLQDLINVVAYQEYREKGLVEGPELPDTAPMTEEEMLKGPEAESIIRALDEVRKQGPTMNQDEENEDGRQ